MQNIVLFIEPTTNTYYTPSKIAHLFINRFAIEEDKESEILKIFELSDKISDLAFNNGMDLIIIKPRTLTSRVSKSKVFLIK